MTSSAAEVYAAAWREGIAPESDLSVDEWADRYRQLSPDEGNEYGKYRVARTPYLREIMQRLSANDPTEQVVLMKGSQIGATQAGICWLGYIMSQAPAPVLVVKPTRELAQDDVQVRLMPMIESTPTLRDRIRGSKSTMFTKYFLGGVLRMRGANAPASFRQISVRNVMVDDVDGLPPESGREGDPITLLLKRTTTFPNRKVYLVSTPTLKGLSRIERAYDESDKRRYFVPCPHCGHCDWIRWENIRYSENDPETARLVCVACSQAIEERWKTQMLERGEWRSTLRDPSKANAKVAGYHLSGLYSPVGWKRWAELVDEWLKAQKDRRQLKAFVNTVLGETWEERGSGIEADELLDRLEAYPAEVPNGVGILVAGADVQSNRIELAVWGYGAMEECWLVHFEQILGDPEQPQVWIELDKALRRTFTHESGQQLRIECAAIDSGYQAEAVYRFCKARVSRRIFATKGDRRTGRPIITRPSTRGMHRALLFMVCVDTAKSMIYGRLNIGAGDAGDRGRGGPGFIHLPSWTDPEFVEQLSAERGYWTSPRIGPEKRVWEKTRERNEALDLAVLGLAALYIANGERGELIRRLPERAAALAQRIEASAAPKPQPPTVQVDPRLLRRRPGGWVGRWRR